MSTYYESCCDRLPEHCICGAELAYCSDCGETLVEGQDVERALKVLCRDCAHEAREEEATKC
jgi:hypothetical protein